MNEEKLTCVCSENVFTAFIESIPNPIFHLMRLEI